MLHPLFKKRKRKGNSQLSHPFWHCQTLLCRIHLLPGVMIKIYLSVSSDEAVKKGNWSITEDILSSCQEGFLCSWALLPTQPRYCSHSKPTGCLFLDINKHEFDSSCSFLPLTQCTGWAEKQQHSAGGDSFVGCTYNWTDLMTCMDIYIHSKSKDIPRRSNS